MGHTATWEQQFYTIACLQPSLDLTLWLIYNVYVCGCSVIQSCLTLCSPCTVACHAPLFMGFSRQEYWSGLPLPTPGDLADPGIEPISPAWPADSLPLSHLGSPVHSGCSVNTGWMNNCMKSVFKVLTSIHLTALWFSGKNIFEFISSYK